MLNNKKSKLYDMLPFNNVLQIDSFMKFSDTNNSQANTNRSNTPQVYTTKWKAISRLILK